MNYPYLVFKFKEISVLDRANCELNRFILVTGGSIKIGLQWPKRDKIFFCHEMKNLSCCISVIFPTFRNKRESTKHCAYSQNKFNFPADLDIRRERFMFLDPWISMYIKLFVFTLVMYFMKNQLLSSLYPFFVHVPPANQLLTSP